MVPVVPLFSTQHWTGKILALSQELRYENNVMDKIWDGNSFEVPDRVDCSTVKDNKCKVPFQYLHLKSIMQRTCTKMTDR